MDSAVTSLVDYYVSVAVILSKVLQKVALQALAGLLRVKSPPRLKASPRSVHHLSLNQALKMGLKWYIGLAPALSTEVNRTL